MDEWVVGVGGGLLAAFLLFVVGAFVFDGGRGSVARNCDDYGAFEHDGTVYECAVKKAKEE